MEVRSLAVEDMLAGDNSLDAVLGNVNYLYIVGAVKFLGGNVEHIAQRTAKNLKQAGYIVYYLVYTVVAVYLDGFYLGLLRGENILVVKGGRLVLIPAEAVGITVVKLIPEFFFCIAPKKIVYFVASQLRIVKQ